MEFLFMSYLKKGSLLLASVVSLTAASIADDGFKLSEKLSVSGFIDMSYFNQDFDNAGTSSVDTARIDQFEIDFKYDFGQNLTAQVDLEAKPRVNTATPPVQTDNYDAKLESAFFTYKLSEMLSVTGGRFLGFSGWETAEPTGLYQYSATPLAGLFYAGYQDGVSMAYSSEMFDFGVSAVDEVYGTSGKTDNANNMGYETMLAFHTGGFTIKGFYMSDSVAATVDKKVIDIWASYVTGGLTLAAEYCDGSDMAAKGDDANGYLLMANYAWDKFGITLRYHLTDEDNSKDSAGAAVTDKEMSGITLSPSFKVTDNLTIITEYRMESVEYKLAGANTSDDWNQFGIEALITF
jgi:hypothetical protein